ncbi:MAG TPA: HAD family hydrolase [Thermoanaerobaculia bacterium]|nr:HAD family hydrolase [Thermoanaerobaculia bacterium]
MKRRLVLFDIDGTLIRDDGAAREAYAEALAAVYGHVDSIRKFDFSGRTDPEITHMVLADGGFPEEVIERSLPELWKHYLDGLQRRVSADRIRVLPGVEQLLNELADRHDVLLAVLTGNIEGGARIKLAPHDLNRYFPFGAFGSDSRFRTELPPIAIERASEIDGHRFGGSDVVIIGDSIYDVRCGTPHFATTIATASGVTPAELLKRESPTFFFDSLEDTEAVIKAILL